MAKGVTLADIAEKVGVSSVAVSKALSGKPGVSDEMRLKIKQVAERMGYIPSSAVKSANMETGHIGVIIPEYYYGHFFSFYGKLYEAVVKTLYDYKYFGILELLSKEDELSGNIPKVMEDWKVDGLILMGQMDQYYINRMVRQAELPVFFLDTYMPSVSFDTVISDGYYGTYMLTNYLLSQGHRKIGFVGSVDATYSISDRFWGYRKALREGHIEFNEKWEIPDRDKYGKTFSKIVAGRTELDAYVCNCDFTAHILIQNLEEIGYSIPEDISVVGFDDFLPVGIGMDMKGDRITSYSVDMKRMAEVCVRSLIRKIKHKKYEEGIQIVTGKIIEKRTVKKRN